MKWCFKFGTFRKDSSGHFPVFVHYSYDATPYLWHFGRKEKIALPVNGRSRVMSEESVPDREIARFELSPSPAKVPVALDVSILSTSAAVPSPLSSPSLTEEVMKQQSMMRLDNEQMRLQLKQVKERLDKLSA